MEWSGKNNPTYFKEEQINEFIDFFTKRNFEPRHPGDLKTLSISNWRNWPGDVVFVQKTFNF